VLAEARAGDVVVVTDHAPEGVPDGGRVRPVLVGEPVENAGIVSAWVEEGGLRFGAVVRNYGAIAQRRTASHPGGETSLDLAPGETELVSGPAPDARAEIVLRPGDRFAFDDRAVVELEAPSPLVLRWEGPAERRLRTALEVGGLVFRPDAEDVLSYRQSPSARTRILVAPPGSRRAVTLRGLAATDRLSVDAVPPPGVRIGETTPLVAGGEAMLVDEEGALAVLRVPRDGRRNDAEGSANGSGSADLHPKGRVEAGFDPADPASTWSEDPSFAIFWREVARILGATEARSAVREGILDPVESGTRAVWDPGDLRGLRPTVPGGEVPGVSLAPWLLLAAGALAGLLVFLGGKEG
jgi:hypothetical protein